MANCENKRIGLISFSNNSDHQEITYSMYEALAEKAEVYTFGIKNPKVPNAPKTAKNFYVDCPKRPGINKDTFLKIRHLFSVVNTIRKRKIQYVYFESLHLWNILVMYLLPRTVTCIEAVHDVIPHDNNRWIRICTKAACRAADGVVIHNEKYADALKQMYKVPAGKVRSMTLWKAFPEKKQPSHTGVFLHFGRIRKYKGLDTFIRIVERTPSIPYCIAGSPDEESKPLVEKLKQFRNVQVIDREVSVEEMGELFAKADWVVLPYESATQSGVIIDAYRFSRPVIAFDVGAISEQVIDGKSGYLVPEKDEEAFAEAVQKAGRMSREAVAAMADAAYSFGQSVYGAEGASEPFVSMLLSFDS